MNGLVPGSARLVDKVRRFRRIRPHDWSSPQQTAEFDRIADFLSLAGMIRTAVVL